MIDSTLERNGPSPSRPVGLAAWSQLLRANCHLLSRSHPDLISAVGVTARLGDAAAMPGLVRSVGERLAAEYDLRLTLDIEGESATACLRRREPRPDGAEPAPLPTAHRPAPPLLPLVCGVSGLAALVILLLGYGEIFWYTPLIVMAGCAVAGFRRPAERARGSALESDRLRPRVDSRAVALRRDQER